MLLIVACSSALRASGTHGIESNNISPSGTEKQKAPNLSVRSLLFAADQNRTDDTGIFRAGVGTEVCCTSLNFDEVY
jgi:hypothetical protein